jgi:predicted dehydrogenase
MATFHGQFLPKYGDVVAVCDVDRAHADKYNTGVAGGKAFVTARHEEVLKRDDVDVVLVASPDHWHAQIAADALRAGKDVYCEKPLTLTIDEGRFLCDVVRQTGRIMQVGTQQRSEDQFVTAIALAQLGRLGKIRRVKVVIGDTPKGVDLKPAAVPDGLDWERWLGQAEMVEYIPERCHNTFRWWYEYSGGRMTDWGAHHVDIAQAAVAPDLPGPMLIEPIAVQHPQALSHGMPTVANAFNTADKFTVRCMFANGVEMTIQDTLEGFGADNGILIEGDGGSLFVNRQKFSGPAVDQLKDNPIPAGVMPVLPTHIQQGHDRHMSNFIDCCRTRSTPRSDVWTHHRHLTTCHLANIAMRLGRAIKWDATAQQIVGDDEANAFQSRTRRKGYELI